MNWMDFLPGNNLLIAMSVFGILKFEVQRWAQQIENGGPRGASDIAMAMVPLTSAVGSLFGIAVWGMIFWYFGWKVAIGSFVVVSVIMILVSGIVTSFLWGNSLVMRLVSLVAIWPAGAYLVYTVLASV